MHRRCTRDRQPWDGRQVTGARGGSATYSGVPDKGGRANPATRGAKAGIDRALSIALVFYAGDEGGICCDVTPRRSNKVFIVSLTHLRLSPPPPLFRAVVAYQL